MLRLLHGRASITASQKAFLLLQQLSNFPNSLPFSETINNTNSLDRDFGGNSQNTLSGPSPNRPGTKEKHSTRLATRSRTAVTFSRQALNFCPERQLGLHLSLNRAKLLATLAGRQELQMHSAAATPFPPNKDCFQICTGNTHCLHFRGRMRELLTSAQRRYAQVVGIFENDCNSIFCFLVNFPPPPPPQDKHANAH